MTATLPTARTTVLTVETAVYRWVQAEGAARKWAAATCSVYRIHGEAFGHAVGASRKVDTITATEIQQWILGDVSPNTRKQRRKVILGLFGWLSRTNQITTNPVSTLPAGVTTRKKHTGSVRPVSANLELIFRYRKDCQRRNLTDDTVARYRDTLLLYVTWLGSTPLLEAQPTQVEAWVDSRKVTGRTAYAFYSTVSGFYQWAIRNELTDRDPTARIPRPKVRQGTPRPIRTDDLEFALAHSDKRMRLWLLLGAHQGLRCKEIAGIRGDDLLLDREPPMIVVSKPKGHRERLLPLNPRVVEALHAYGVSARRAGPIFTLQDGKGEMRGYKVSQTINEHLRDLGIDATAHQLRHWFGTEVYSASRDLRMTQQLLGHSSPTTTAIYAAWSPGEAVGIVQALGQPDTKAVQHEAT